MATFTHLHDLYLPAIIDYCPGGILSSSFYLVVFNYHAAIGIGVCVGEADFAIEGGALMA